MTQKQFNYLEALLIETLRQVGEVKAMVDQTNLELEFGDKLEKHSNYINTILSAVKENYLD